MSYILKYIYVVSMYIYMLTHIHIHMFICKYINYDYTYEYTFRSFNSGIFIAGFYPSCSLGAQGDQIVTRLLATTETR